MKHASKLGFTLAELLAVVIIVALLSGLSLGYYKRSVEDSRFAEGLAAASALVEAVNQSYFDQKLDGATPTTQPKIKTLDINFSNSSPSTEKPYSLFTPRFEVRVESDGNVRAYRGTADTNQYKYYIQIKPSFASSSPNQISCVGANAEGKTFCESMGYTDCSGNACLKCMKTSGSCWN